MFAYLDPWGQVSCPFPNPGHSLAPKTHILLLPGPQRYVKQLPKTTKNSPKGHYFAYFGGQGFDLTAFWSPRAPFFGGTLDVDSKGSNAQQLCVQRFGIHRVDILPTGHPLDSQAVKHPSP